MTYRRWFATALFSLSAAISLTANAADCKALSGKLLDNLDHGDYAAAGGDFDNRMKILNPEKLHDFWQKLAEKLGARSGRGDARLVQKNGNDIVVTPLHFGDKVANSVVVCSPDGRISGFHVYPQP